MDSLLLSRDRSDAGDQQDISLGPVRPQDNAPAFPQNQSQPDIAATSATPPASGAPANPQNQVPPVHATAPANSPPASNNVPAGPTTGPVQVASADHPADPPPQGDGGVAGQVGSGTAPGPVGPAGQGSLSQASNARQPVEDSDTRAVIQPDSGLFGSQFERQIDSILGNDRVRINTEAIINPETVVGNWNLSEEDGMRSCTIGFLEPENGNGALASGGCSPVIGGIQSWGVFGNDLLLRDAQNSVVVRLRRSGEAWVGFTLQAGIPVVLSRG